MELSIDISKVLVGLLGLLTIKWWMKTFRKQSLLPPGPTPWPLLGNLLQMRSKGFLLSLKEFREKYGSVFTIHIGTYPAVMLCGYETVKEALVDHGDSFINRGKRPFFDHMMKGFGIASSNGEQWKEIRRFSISALKSLGLGKRSLEGRIQEGACYLVEKLRETQGSSFDPTFLFSCAVSNIICSVVFGQRFEYTDKRFLSLLYALDSSLHFMNSSWGLVFSSFSKVLPYLPGPHKKVLNHVKDILEFVEERARESQETVNPSAPQHFIDCFLVKMEEEKQNPNTQFHMENLIITVVNLFFAGTETVSSTLRYGFLILIKHPEIQGKIQDELDCVIGRDRYPTSEDKNKLPYTDAMIHEIQRFSDVVPTDLPRSTTEDVSFRGYFIPKGTDVYLVLTTVLQDPGKFMNPEKFWPERFLDEEGNLIKGAAFMPFSAGKQMCPGDGLARLELFLFKTSLLQNFTLTSTVAPEHIDLTGDISSAGHISPSLHLSLNPYCPSIHQVTHPRMYPLLCNCILCLCSIPLLQLFNLFPNILSHLPGPHRKIISNLDKLKQFVFDMVESHRESLDDNSPRDLIDCFLIRMEQERKNSSTEFYYENLVEIVIDLFFAGIETTSTTLRYALLILLKYPEIQGKVHKEIDHVIGQNRCPSIEDRAKMPYTDAVIHEVQRFADIVPTGLIHATSKDTTFRGYNIPKGTQVFTILTSVLKDPKYFKNPHQFDPGHFLDNNGCFKKNEAFIPFSIGKRVCVGEGMARMELFLFITTILQKFTLKPTVDEKDIETTPQPNSNGSTPREYKLFAVPR
ncbi:cytochrome P450 2G1-like [Discoglossus pictus]